MTCPVMDGRWIEGYDGGNGWTFGEVSAAADTVYDLLETAIALRYCEHGPDRFPARGSRW